MTSLTIESFFPNHQIECHNDLTFDDGTYEVWTEDNVILHIFQINNYRITHYYKYNTKINKRLITFLFEYDVAEDGSYIHNVYRHLPNVKDKEMWYSTHWNLYSKEKKHKDNLTKEFDRVWDKYVVDILNTSSVNNVNENDTM